MDYATAKAILCEDEEGYTEVTPSKIVDQGRWKTFYQQVFEKEADGTFWEIFWSRGSTEYQDNGIEDVRCRRVFPKTKTITVYE